MGGPAVVDIVGLGGGGGGVPTVLQLPLPAPPQSNQIQFASRIFIINFTKIFIGNFLKNNYGI